MNQYFSAYLIHCQGKTDIDAKQLNVQGNELMVASIGEDSILCVNSINTKNLDRQEMPSQTNFTSIALHPSGKWCLLAEGNKITKRVFDTEQMSLVYQSLGKILSLSYSKSGRYVCVSTEQQKCNIIDMVTNKNMKCRPGHLSKLIYAFFSPDQKYIGSIGEDKQLIVYENNNLLDQPQQISKNKIIKSDQSIQNWMACFNHKSNKIAAPGREQVQFIQLINKKWEMKKTNMKDQRVIIICEFVDEDFLVTSSASQNVIIWNYQAEERMVTINETSFLKIVPVGNTFFAIKSNDGTVYQYSKPLLKVKPKENNQEVSQASIINFDQMKASDGQEQQQQSYSYHHVSKKSKADKIITVYPQSAISRKTQPSDGNRFLYVNDYGMIIQRKELDETIIELQIYLKTTKTILFRNRQFTMFAVTGLGVAFANEIYFGFRSADVQMWQKKWANIQGISLGNNWIAVMGQSQIKIYDLVGNLIKSICFDREFVAMDSYQNLLVIVHHEGIPIYGSQNLSLRIYSIDRLEQLKHSRNHLPLSSQSVLRWLGFSRQGMLFSQDSKGAIRCYSLQSNQWTKVQFCEIINSSKVWIVGIINYQVRYWKTTELEPQPTVFPMLPQKSISLTISFDKDEITEDQEKHGKLLWKRYCLQHQKARLRLWGRYKMNRQVQDELYLQSQTIMSFKSLQNAKIELDNQFSNIAHEYLKNNQPQKALAIAKSFVKSLNVGRNLVEIFDQFKHRSYAIDLESYYDDRQKQLQFESIQQLQLQKLKIEAQKNIKPYPEDPMKKNSRKIGDRYPSISQSQSSQIIQQVIPVPPKQNNVPKKNVNTNDSFENPFLKNNISKVEDEKKQKQIEEHIAKHAVKQKSGDRTAIPVSKRQLK